MCRAKNLRLPRNYDGICLVDFLLMTRIMAILSRKRIISLIFVVVCVFIITVFFLHSSRDPHGIKDRALRRSPNRPKDEQLLSFINSTQLHIHPKTNAIDGTWKIWILRDKSAVLSGNSTRANKVTSVFLVDKTIKIKYFTKHHVIFPFRGWIEISSRSAISPIEMVMKKHNYDTSLSVNYNPCKNESNWEQDTDYKGGDLENVANPVQAASAAECCQSCTNTPECGHWTFTTDGCWLKNLSPLIKSKNPGLISGTPKGKPEPILFNQPNNLPSYPQNPQQSSSCCNAADDEVILNNLQSTYTPQELKAWLESTLSSYNSGGGKNILQTKLITGNWEEQMLIGNGKLGAMIGGTSNYEIIPISIANLYGYNRPHVKRGNNAKVVANENNNNDNKQSNNMTLLDARYCLLHKDHRCAQKYFTSFQQDNLGMFEYFADLSMVFASNPLEEKQNANKQPVPPAIPHIPSLMNQKGLKVSMKPPPFRPQPMRPITDNGRHGIIEHMQSKFQGLGGGPQNDLLSNGPAIREQDSNVHTIALLSEGILSLEDGLASSSFLTSEEEQLQGQSRVWFASERYDVMVGRMNAVQIAASNNNSAYEGFDGGLAIGALNVAIRLSRHKPSFQAPHVVPHFQPYHLAPQQLSMLMDTSKDREEHRYDAVQAYSMKLDLSSTEFRILPAATMCGVILCKGKQGIVQSYRTQEDNQDPNSLQQLVCNSAEEMDVYLSVEKAENLGLSLIELEATKTQLPDLQKKCMAKLERSLSIPYEELMQSHMQVVSERMNRIEFQITADNSQTNGSKICPNLDINDRLESFQKGCYNVVNRTVEKSLFDENLVMNSFQYGRYLSLASSSQSVSNLQGIWGDGVNAVWNGDYHFNINAQMLYWSSGNARLEEVFHPLLQLVEKLSFNGRIAANKIYNCPFASRDAWVAHGFTDSRLDGGIFGDLQWSLCVTCGAWLSVQLFDWITYQTIDYELLEIKIIPIHRGIVNFFLHHMFFTSKHQPDQILTLQDILTAKLSLEDFIAHTGPTTSPENSYKILFSNTTNSLIEVLAFTPALDISILRQIGNMFSFMIESLRRHYSAIQKQPSLQLVNDQQLARDFMEIMKALPNRGIPLIHPQDNHIVEYPDPIMQQYWSSPDARNPNLNDARMGGIQDDLDPGHRHFSSMHWLFPSVFMVYGGNNNNNNNSNNHPRNCSNRIHPHNSNTLGHNLYQAARNTLKKKRLHNGGHTSWSAAWEASLYARLFDGENAKISLDHILSKYMTQNLLSLHPPLQDGFLDGCSTCFQESLPPKPSKFILPPGIPSMQFLSRERGLVTTTQSKFQLDGNAGYVAAVLEMLYQTHLPNAIVILPALPKAWRLQGHLYGVQGRGNVQISFVWQHGQVVFLHLHFPSSASWDHPWWYVMQEEVCDFPGFYAPSSPGEEGKTEMKISVIAPNTLTLQSASSPFVTTTTSTEWSDCIACSYPPIREAGMKVITLTIQRNKKPLDEKSNDMDARDMYFCGQQLSPQTCHRYLQEHQLSVNK